jgi:FtsP/CotA-like multicopper oxidase with cupredoxin domain
MFKVTRGQKYLFRVIGTGALYPWRISVDQHNLTMVAVDGFDITPVVAPFKYLHYVFIHSHWW